MKERLHGLVRAALAASGGAFVTAHLDDLTSVITGALVIAATAAWSWWSKRYKE
jgi:1-deoxy-D-xylulose 5-phosphate reductoisomerase